MTKIAITGAAGRMGRRIAALTIENDGLELVAAMEVAGNPCLGQDVGTLAGAGEIGVKVSETIDAEADVLIDFSLPDGTMHWVEVCSGRGVAMVIGTTRLSAGQEAAVAEAARTIPIVHAGNMSVGINLLLNVVALVARTLGPDYDIEVAETHHRFKKDAPSGTAVMLAKSICNALGKDYPATAVHGREGHQPRQPGEIGMHALRVGDTVGEHSVYFGNLGETITVSHSAHSRDIFVHGALRAAEWLSGRPAGLYSMQEVLGLAIGD